MSNPISFSDSAIDNLISLTRPLTPLARHAFLEALVVELRAEPQPVADGTTSRVARTLLKSGMFEKAGQFICDETKPQTYRRRA
jgi:hypothetical protein